MKHLIQKFTLLMLLLPMSIYAWKMEADIITVKRTKNDTITHINFRHTFDTKPLVFTLTDEKGSNPAALRVNNITTTGFDIYTVEPDGEDGPHAKMNNIPYIAIEPGDHKLPDGTRIIAKTISTKKYQAKLLSGSSWEHIDLSGFNTTPIVLGQIQTRVNERTDENVPDAVSQPWITTIINKVDSDGFDIALERSETKNGDLNSDETIAYLVMESGLNGDNHYFGSSDGTKVEYETIRSDEIIEGWDDGNYTVNFSKSYDNPVAVATKNTRNDNYGFFMAGNDGGWLRRGDIENDHITLTVDEDRANDSERSHPKERAGLLVFSEPFDADFDYSEKADMKINEVMFRQTSNGSSNDEFVELYVSKAGDIKNYVISDQDCNFYRFPSCSVNKGDYVILHTGDGTNSCSGNVKHFYANKSPVWNDSNDDVLLLKPSQDVTTTTNQSSCGKRVFNTKPFDYIAYGRNSVGGYVDDIPTSMNNVSVDWNYDYGSELKVDKNHKGLSIALTPNGIDSDKSACWEKTASGNASDNGCENYLPTSDTNPDAKLTYSLGENNNAKPKMSIAKSSIAIDDPVNGTTNPKRIPGATVRYCFTVKNSGNADAGDVAISDTLDGNNRDKLIYVKSGKGDIINNTDNCTPSDCKAITDTSGNYDSDTKKVDINLANPFSSNSHQCAYIETTVK